MPDYGELVETIKSADNRIQYVALQPIANDDYEKVDNDLFNSYFKVLDIMKRSILAGITPWSTRYKGLDIRFG